MSSVLSKCFRHFTGFYSHQTTAYCILSDYLKWCDFTRRAYTEFTKHCRGIKYSFFARMIWAKKNKKQLDPQVPRQREFSDLKSPNSRLLWKQTCNISDKLEIFGDYFSDPFSSNTFFWRISLRFSSICINEAQNIYLDSKLLILSFVITLIVQMYNQHKYHYREGKTVKTV